MKQLKANEIRELFLQFYKDKGHTHVASASLIPENDPTLLFTAAGMVPFKDVFTGIEKRDYTRATTAQKVLRAGGKHNDLENVGFTARHNTFFEMLGNFSFGDYFKKEAIQFAWEFVTEHLKLDKSRLYVTIYLDDEEAFKIWHEDIGVEKERIYRFDEDNFWSAGDVGPCGPSSEIFYDQGEAFNTGDPEMDKMGGEGDRFLEFYNLVFMQYERDANGQMTPLPKPSVDTGLGLERITTIMQTVASNYDTDIFQPIIQAIAKQSNISYTTDRQESSIAMRVIADHLRAVSFLAADGLVPSNEGRGYVMRRILRRAVLYGKKIGFEKSFLADIFPSLQAEMGKAYPELIEKADFIRNTIQQEEEKFFATLEKGLQILQNELDKLEPGSTLSGKTAFLLHDSFGFPLDLTQVITTELNFKIDEEAFAKEMQGQKEQSKAKDSKTKKSIAQYEQLAAQKLQTEFTGYESLEDKGKVLALLHKDSMVENIHYQEDGDNEFEVIFDRSPLYAESGGQAGDSGELWQDNQQIAVVTDVTKPLSELSVVQAKLLPNAKIAVGTELQQKTSAELRQATANNHSATHLLHWALRDILGTHVKQAGSLVNTELLRFDFTHGQSLSEQERKKINQFVNQEIARANSVQTELKSKEAAIEAGAMALFGEKYANDVRVVSMGPSTELCGGTHVQNTKEIQAFAIVKEMGIAAGTRRIIAKTSSELLQYLQTQESELQLANKKFLQQADSLYSEWQKIDQKAKWDASPFQYESAQLQTDQINQEILQKLETKITEAQSKNTQLQNELKSMQKTLQKAKEKQSSQGAATHAQTALETLEKINAVECIRYSFAGGMKDLRALGDLLRQKSASALICIAAKETDKAFLLVNIPKSYSKSFHAGKIIAEIAPEISGKGGGKAEVAQAGGSNPNGVEQALEKFSVLIRDTKS